jgi:hypothetical protein
MPTTGTHSLAEHFGDKMLWLQQHQTAIDWTSCEDVKEQIQTYKAPKITAKDRE